MAQSVRISVSLDMEKGPTFVMLRTQLSGLLLFSQPTWQQGYDQKFGRVGWAR